MTYCALHDKNCREPKMKGLFLLIIFSSCLVINAQEGSNNEEEKYYSMRISAPQFYLSKEEQRQRLIRQSADELSEHFFQVQQEKKKLQRLLEFNLVDGYLEIEKEVDAIMKRLEKLQKKAKKSLKKFEKNIRKLNHKQSYHFEMIQFLSRVWITTLPLISGIIFTNDFYIQSETFHHAPTVVGAAISANFILSFVKKVLPTSLKALALDKEVALEPLFKRIDQTALAPFYLVNSFLNKSQRKTFYERVQEYGIDFNNLETAVDQIDDPENYETIIDEEAYFNLQTEKMQVRVPDDASHWTKDWFDYFLAEDDLRGKILDTLADKFGVDRQTLIDHELVITFDPKLRDILIGRYNYPRVVIKTQISFSVDGVSYEEEFELKLILENENQFSRQAQAELFLDEINSKIWPSKGHLVFEKYMQNFPDSSNESESIDDESSIDFVNAKGRRIQENCAGSFQKIEFTSK